MTMARYNSTHPMQKKVHDYEELKVMSIGCSNLWDMRILQDFILFSQGNTLFHLQYEIMVNHKNEIKFDFEYLVRFLVIVIHILHVSTDEIRQREI